MSERPRVYVRFRPDKVGTKSEAGTLLRRGPTADGGARGACDGVAEIKVDGKKVMYPHPNKDGKQMSLAADHVFVQASKQDDVYDVVGKPMLDDALQGLRACILAYGITGSGKTFTMLGKGVEEGLVFRVLRDACSRALAQFSVTLQVIQLYHDDFQDLGSPSQPKPKIKVQSTPNVDNTGASDMTFTSFESLQTWLQDALKHRHAAPTARNKESSRSHLLVRCKFNHGDTAANNRGVLDLVDLAGSEDIMNDIDREARRDHLCIQTGLHALQHCIESKVANAKKRQDRRREVPFPHHSLPRLLGPNFASGARIACIVTCPGDGRDRPLETAKALYFGKKFSCLELNIRTKEETIVATPQQVIMMSDNQAVQVTGGSPAGELPGGEAEASSPPQPPAVRYDSRELLDMKRELEQQKHELHELAEQVKSQGFLAAELRTLLANIARKENRPRSSRSSSSLHDIGDVARRLMRRIEECYPDVVQETWPDWDSELSSPPLRLDSLRRSIAALTEAVAEHEQKLCAVMKRKLELLRVMPQDGDDDAFGRTLSEMNALKAAQAKQLEGLNQLLNDVSDERQKMLRGWVEHNEKLEAKKDEVDVLEAEVTDRSILKLDDKKETDKPLLEDLDADMEAWSGDPLQEALDDLPGSSSKIVHLLRANPSWKAHFYHLHGVHLVVEKMAQTKNAHCHRRLAWCVGEVLDMERLEPDEATELRPQLVNEMLEVTPYASQSPRFTALHKEDNESCIEIYMKFLEGLAKDIEARKMLASHSVRCACELIHHKTQPAQIAAMDALGQVAADMVALQEDDLQFLLRLVGLENESPKMRAAAARCLQRLCYGTSDAAKSSRSSLERLNAVQVLTSAVQSVLAHEENANRDDYHDISKHAKNAAFLLLHGREQLTEPLRVDSVRMLLEAVAASASVSFLKDAQWQGVAAGVHYWGHVRYGSWQASSTCTTAGGHPALCSTHWWNPAYLIRLRPVDKNRKQASIAIALVNPESDDESKEGPGKKTQRTAYHGTEVVSFASSKSDESGGKAALVHSVINEGLNPPLSSDMVKGRDSSRFRSPNETLQYLTVNVEDEHVLMPYLLTPLQQRRYALSVFADAPLELVPLSPNGWHVRSFVGKWSGEAPRAAPVEGQDELWRRHPQLMITNKSRDSITICCILSYRSTDDAEMKKHKWHEENDRDVEQCSKDAKPWLDLNLYDTTIAQRYHRYVGRAPPVAHMQSVSKDFVALYASLPPHSSHNLVMARTWLLKGDAPTPAAPQETEGLRLQVLAGSGEVEFDTVGRGNSEWQLLTSPAIIVKDRSSKRLSLSFKNSGQQSSEPEEYVQLVVRTSMGATESRKVFLRLSTNGKKIEQNKYAEYWLDATELWTITVEYHQDWMKGFEELPCYLCVQAYLLSRNAKLEWLDGVELAEGSSIPGALKHQHSKWLEELKSVELPSCIKPHTKEDLRLEEDAFPPAVSSACGTDDEKVLVDKAYLRRLHRLAWQAQLAAAASSTARSTEAT